ncbi:hypothetical protein KFK09_029016 [Dendrobium nobile]|uniref:Uncharacterized protein n=1 Tax=Dendrobium nobile TaxID=94219 RepID=A0A8T3A3J0_DENNO|nr:hypothetical protein KFK09_029016 [Dendrobium nobile]
MERNVEARPVEGRVGGIGREQGLRFQRLDGVEGLRPPPACANRGETKGGGPLQFWPSANRGKTGMLRPWRASGSALKVGWAWRCQARSPGDGEGAGSRGCGVGSVWGSRTGKNREGASGRRRTERETGERALRLWPFTGTPRERWRRSEIERAASLLSMVHEQQA